MSPVFTSPPSPPPSGLRLQVTRLGAKPHPCFHSWFVHSFIQQTLIEVFTRESQQRAKQTKSAAFGAERGLETKQTGSIYKVVSKY